MDTFNVYALIALANAIGSFAIGLFVFLQNRKNRAHQTFFLLTLSVTIWSVAYYGWQMSNFPQEAYFWCRYLMAGAIFIPVTYLHFIFSFLGENHKYRRQIFLSYLIFFGFLIFDFTPYFINRIEPALGFKYWPKPGPVFNIFLFVWLSYAFYGAYLLAKAYRRHKGAKKVQIGYLLAGILLGYIGGSTNYFLWYNIPVAPIANAFVILQLLAIALAILRHHLLNIKIITTELLVGLINFVLFINIFSYETSAQLITNIAIFLLTVLFSVQLIKSVLKEVESREKSQKLAKKLRQANRKLKKLDKTKSEFVSIASHQLRTPLTAIKGYAAMLIDDSKNPEEKQALRQIYFSNERLIKLVNDLLNLSRIERGKMQFHFVETQLSDIISSVISELKMLVRKKGLKLTYHKVDLPILKIDPTKIKEVLVNIIDNAIKYTPKGKITVKTFVDEDSVIVAISDTGIGMSKDDVKAIYQKFQRGRAVSQVYPNGTGIGLYIANKIIQAHNGRLWAESDGLGRGSTFYIKLPLSS